jgi:hypothetical protein
MTNPNLKTREQVSTTIEIKLIAKLRKLSATTRIDMSKLFDEAVTDLLKKYEVKK